MSDAPASPCESCGGTGFLIVESAGASRARPCGCRPRAGRAPGVGALLEAARVPPRYRECDFENFAVYGEHGLTLTRAKVEAQRYAEEYPLNEFGLLLMGPPGVGKTHLTVATIRRLMVQNGVPCLFYDVQDLLRQLQATFDRQSGMTELELLQPVLTTEVVVLDDLGGRQHSAWVEETLTHIVTTRYNEKRATLVTTNYFDAPDNPRLLTLTDRIGFRVRSRLYEMCRLVEVRAEDFRRQIKLADHHGAAGRTGRPEEHA